MKLKLPDALHARPANLVVRAASQQGATITIIKGEKRANAADILQVLALGAAKGDEIELHSDDDAALQVLAQLILDEFDPDLVPENGAVAAPGIAIGEAIVFLEEEADRRARGSDEEELARARAAFDRARQDVEAVIRALPAHEAQLFEPELLILQSLEPMVLKQIEGGAIAEDAVRAEAVSGPSDLIDDARRRLLDALAGGDNPRHKRFEETRDREIILVIEGITPSAVASAPEHVIGIIAATEEATGTTSHAAILARGRGLPLAYVPSHVAFAIEDGMRVVLDTTEVTARIWADPSDELIAEARARKEQLRLEDERASRLAVEPLPLVAVRVNIGSTRERVPEGAEGIGLLRTELVFADSTHAPTEEEQIAAYSTIARKTSGPVLVRLFDAGGDKPLPFLPGDERGIALLRANPSVLEAQLRAIAKTPGDVRVLIPLVRGPDDVTAVRRGNAKVGAMIETPQAAEDIDAIAAVSDFICIGTNDLASETLGLSREQAPDPLDPRVLRHIGNTVRGAHAKNLKVTVCGEVAADPRGARILIGLGVDALSVAPKRFAALKLSLADATVDDCRAAAGAALGDSP
jgi:phosphotransferase system HPr (HPr) family protein